MPLSVSQLQTRQIHKFHYLTICIVAFAQGTYDLCSLSYFYIYFYDLNCSPSFLSLLQGLAVLPWCFKPFLGYLNDHVPFLGYKKKSYLFVISIVEFLSHLIMFHFRLGLFGVLISQIIQIICIVFRNVITGKPISIFQNEKYIYILNRSIDRYFDQENDGRK